MIFNSHHQPNIIVPITGTTAQMLLEEARAAEAAGADVIEWRIDFLIGTREMLSFVEIGKEVIEPLLKATTLPLLFTLRTAEQGGQVKLRSGRYRLLFAELLDTLVQLGGVDPRRIGIDLEYSFPQAASLAGRARAAGYTVVISLHDWKETPDNEILKLLFLEMLKIPDAIPKIAVTAHNEQDANRLLEVTKEVVAESARPVIAVAMGEAGKNTRLFGWQAGSIATFAHLNGESAPGQPSLAELQQALAVQKKEIK